MDVKDMISLIKDVGLLVKELGFPIVVCAVLYVQNTKVLTSMQKVLNETSTTLKTIVDKIQEIGYDIKKGE